ncbi:hypothetical protein Golomagni_01073 [Golovinomyces magnicellulatus]|nr:hypothetical protein Golomagni_01073 [Golovinomyces magnicellulatus]
MATLNHLENPRNSHHSYLSQSTSFGEGAQGAHDQADTKYLRVKGPVRLTTKTLKVTIIKKSCSEGLMTRNSFEIKIHQQLIDLSAPTEIIKIIVTIEAVIEVEAAFAA